MNRNTFDILFVELYNEHLSDISAKQVQIELNDAYESLRQFFGISDCTVKPHIHVQQYECDNECNSKRIQITCLVYDTLLCFDSDDTRWFKIEAIHFENGEMSYAKSEVSVNVSVFANEIACIELYPFEQCKEVSLHLLGFKSELLDSMGYFCDCEEMQIQDLILTIDEECTYTLLRDGHPIAGFYNKDTSFQPGDSYTEVFVYNKTDIIIANYGDVSSIVVFKGCFVIKD